MRTVKRVSLLLVSVLAVSLLSASSPASAVTPSDVTSFSESLTTDSGMIQTAQDLAGVDSDIVKEFQLGVKYGEFATRLYQGDYWGVAVDFVKFELGNEVDRLTESATKKLLSAGAQRMLTVFTALKDTGIWLGNKALDMQFNAAVKAGYEMHKANVGQADYRVMMDIWWIKYGKGKISKIDNKEITEEMWLAQFSKAYGHETVATAAPENAKEMAVAEKVLKKAAVVKLFALKYPGMAINVSEQLADAIVNRSGSATIKKIAENYKKHLATLNATTVKGESASSSGICQGTKQEQQSCLDSLQKLIAARNKVLTNVWSYSGYLSTADRLQPESPGALSDSGMPTRGSAGASNLVKFKKAQESIIASAYGFAFGQEIQGINSSLNAAKSYFESLKSSFGSLPKAVAHTGPPDYKVSENKAFVRVFMGIVHPGINYGQYQYEDFVSGVAQAAYEKFFPSEAKANAVDDVRMKAFKAYLLKLNGLIHDFTALQSRTNSLIELAKSSWGVFSYGEITVDDLERIVPDIGNLKKLAQSGEWSWSVDNVSGIIKGMESYKKDRILEISQMKADYAGALKMYAKEVADRKQEKLDAEKLTKSPSPTPTVTKKATPTPTPKPTATKKTPTAFSSPFASKKPAATPTPTVTATKKITTPTPKPTATKKISTPSRKASTLPSGYSVIPNENVEIVGFAFTAKGKADMMIQDFFWSDVMYTVKGALDLGKKTLNDVTSVPSSGYKADPYKLVVGHVYAIKTRGGKFGIIQIAFIEPGERLSFFWRYQPDGSTNFS